MPSSLRLRFKPQLRPWSSTAEELEFIRATDPTAHWLENLSEEVLRKYKGQWIAAKDCQVIESAPTCAELYDKIGQPRDPTILVLRLQNGITIY